jgi:ketosteroid isomerase-like protein
MELVDLYRRTVEAGRAASSVGDDQWDLPTPCAEWSVRGLVNHVVGEDLWTKPLLEGRTIADVGDALGGDLLGDDPGRCCRRGRASPPTARFRSVVRCTCRTATRTWVSTSGSCVPTTLSTAGPAAATGANTTLDVELVDDVAGWFAERSTVPRSRRDQPHGSAYGRSCQRPAGGFGRDAEWGPNHATLAAFSAAFGSGDVDAIMALMTDDCVFEATGPAPDGTRVEGADAVRQVWVDLFGMTADAAFTEEESFVAGDRAVLRWLFTWANADGSPGHVRGVDILRISGGKVGEKLSYVRG